MLVFPMQGQFEQELNAFQMQENGFGCAATEPAGEVIGNFFYCIPDIQRRIRECHRDNGQAIKSKLNELVDDEARVAREFKARRSGAKLSQS